MADNPGVQYDPAGSMIGIVVRIKSTVVPQVLRRLEFWLLIVANITFTYMHQAGIVTADDAIPGALLHPITALMVFGLVFYTNQCFSRYFTLYGTARDMMGIMHELVSECRIRLKDKLHQKKVVHYTLAGVFAFFFEATRGELGDEEFEELVGRGLLNETEVAFIQRYPTKRKSFVCLQWALEVAALGLGDGGKRFINLFTAKLYYLRRAQQDVADTLQMPLPFQYFHIVNLMLLVNLSLLAFTLGSYQNYVVTAVFAFVELIFMGIREMAVAMADPFGDDEVDFPVDDWLVEVLETSKGLLESEYRVDNEENCENVPPLTDEHCEGMDLAFFETRRAMIERYCSSKKRDGGGGFNPPHEDLLTRRGTAPVKASRGRLRDPDEEDELLGGKKGLFGFKKKKKKGGGAAGGAGGKAEEDDGDE